MLPKGHLYADMGTLTCLYGDPYMLIWGLLYPYMQTVLCLYGTLIYCLGYTYILPSGLLYAS